MNRWGWAGLGSVFVFVGFAAAVSAGGQNREIARVVVVRGQVTASGRTLSALSQVTDGVDLVVGRSSWVKLLTRGGCVLRAGPGTRFRLEKSSSGGGCPSVKLSRGRLQLVVSDQWSRVAVGAYRLRSRNGVVDIEGAAIPRVCVRHGRTDVVKKVNPVPVPVAQPASPGGSAAPPLKTRFEPIPAGRCFSAGRMEPLRSAARFPVLVRGVLPAVRMDPEKLLPTRRTQGGTGGGEGPGQVSGASGSMCLDSTGSGASAGNVQQGNQPIDKPPPASRVRVRIVLPGR